MTETAEQTIALKNARAWAGKAAAALDARDAHIRAARDAGASLRQIADVVGLTAMGVKGICDREPAKAAAQ